VGTIPLLYLDSLCAQPMISAEFDGDAKLCFESGQRLARSASACVCTPTEWWLIARVRHCRLSAHSKQV
jgi:hypothetical protein